jgi:hypothetical protein
MLYHCELGFPTIPMPSGIMALTYSQHARSAAADDQISLPQFLDPLYAKLIEVEIEGRKVIKCLYRVKYNRTHDLCLAVKPDGFVKTVWTNRVNDTHKTLNRERYASCRS